MHQFCLNFSCSNIKICHNIATVLANRVGNIDYKNLSCENQDHRNPQLRETRPLTRYGTGINLKFRKRKSQLYSRKLEPWKISCWYKYWEFQYVFERFYGLLWTSKARAGSSRGQGSCNRDYRSTRSLPCDDHSKIV